MKGLKSWKTTLAGAAGAALIAVTPLFQGRTPTWKELAGAGIVAAFGWFAKDSNVTGGDKANAK